jgi:hypothetical protein
MEMPPEGGLSVVPVWFFLERLDVVRLQTLRAALHLKLDFLPFLESLEAGHLNRGVMREQVLAALARGDEAEAFGVVEPLYGTGCHLLFPVQIAATNPGATKPGTKYQQVEFTATTDAAL